MSVDTPDDPVAFTTVEDDLPDEEVASSFKELLDWMRYLAQHKEQRGRLLALLTVAGGSLRDLMGLEEDQPTPTYAHVAATSAPQPSLPKRAKTAPTATTKRQIQHAITRFERVTRELPGAPKSTLLDIVSRSNLKNAPPPLPEAPKPRRKPSCLTKGIRANTIAIRLSETAVVPSSLPALIYTVNKQLKTAKLNGQIKEILQGLRRHITIVFDQVVEDDTSKYALNEVLKGFKTEERDSHLLERPTHSSLKFNAVPTVTTSGQPSASCPLTTTILVFPTLHSVQKHPPQCHRRPLRRARRGKRLRHLRVSPLQRVGPTQLRSPHSVPRRLPVWHD